MESGKDRCVQTMTVDIVLEIEMMSMTTTMEPLFWWRPLNVNTNNEEEKDSFAFYFSAMVPEHHLCWFHPSGSAELRQLKQDEIAEALRTISLPPT